ncbi:hypothetical protein FraEuI1c_6179 [Pseudofrankia inefficax]|uniref:Uncharacterized protein n=1 Tax=Pseudofrankia inefficax (strain DSM 45817 / CECT 9037 / DDB 130130 / EuI1c) TaxID=298654 RepID=E3J366_PSEI1|nr:hypothetical protein FraEuI1c_6179 [Pseudofrankia inefficax]
MRISPSRVATSTKTRGEPLPRAGVLAEAGGASVLRCGAEWAAI